MLEYLCLIILLLLLGMVDKMLDDRISQFVIDVILFILLTIWSIFKLIPYLICLPVRLIKYGISESDYAKRITENYDYIFFKSKNMKAVSKRMKKVKKLTWNCKLKKEANHEKETVKYLNQSKWLM